MDTITSYLDKCQPEEQGNIIIERLKHRFGILPEFIVNQVQSLKPNQLDTLTEDLLDFQSLGDLQVWLVNA